MQLAITIEPDHPAFAGHFPARPIVPGVVLLDHGLRALVAHRHPGRAWDDQPPCRIGAAKFLSIIGPGEPLRLEVDATAGDASYRLRIFAGPLHDERLALTGTVTFESGTCPVEGSAA